MTGMAAAARAGLAVTAMIIWSCHKGPARAAEPLAPSDDAAQCQGAIEAVEQQSSLPRRLLSAISLVESGRVVPGRRVAAWPWTINVGGVGTFYDTAEAAIAAAEALQGSGIRSFDVGCMQVNLKHHPTAFASLHDAFDPRLNASYAARFLEQLHAELGDWSQTVAAYHSRAAEPGADYQRRVVRAWPEAAAYGVAALPGAVRRSVVEAPIGEQTPEFAARLREAAADHAALTRRIVGGNLPRASRIASGTGNPRFTSASSQLRLTQGSNTSTSILRQ